MHDTVIRSGTIFDGTGAAAFAGDVAIDSGLITQVGIAGFLATDGRTVPSRKILGKFLDAVVVASPAPAAYSQKIAFQE